MKLKKILLPAFALLSLCSCASKPINAKAIIFGPKEVKREFVGIGTEYLDSVRAFSSNFTESFLDSFELGDKENVSMSPISAYSTLATASAITTGNSQKEILDVLGVDFSTLKEKYDAMYRSILSDSSRAYTLMGDGAETFKSHLSNSVWLDSSIDYKEEALKTLSDSFYAYSIKEDFARNPGKANRDIRKFIKNETDKLLDVDLQLDSKTVFVLLNCLYLKDLWNYDGSNITLDDRGSYDFINGDKSITSTKLMSKAHRVSKIYEGEGFTSFDASTHNGTAIHFFKPEDGKEVKEIFTKENIIKTLEYSSYEGGVDEENKIIYHTRASFPAFSADCNKDIIPVYTNMGVNTLFGELNPDFSPLTESSDITVSQIKHVTKLKVDRKGIEGAAVIAMIGAGATGPRKGYRDVYEDFIVDKAFGYVIERGGIPLFSGVVNSIDAL